MHEKVTPFPIPPHQRVGFLMGSQRYVLIIQAPSRRKPKPAEIILILGGPTSTAQCR